MINLAKNVDENENQYIWRLCDAKDKGLLDTNWDELGEIINKNLFGEDINLYRTSSAFRKPYQYARDFYKDVFLYLENDSYISEIQEKEREIKKEIIKLRDERTDINKRIRFESRLEDKLDKIENLIKQDSKNKYTPVDINIEKSDNDLLVILSDLHIGAEFYSCLGMYNSDIAKDRLNTYLKKIIEIQKRHKSENCFIFLEGDLISGNIHKTIAVSNRENVIEQIKLASNYISDFIYELSLYFNKVNVYSVGGNHSRLEIKDDAIKNERLDSLIPWYVKSSLSHILNVNIIEDKIDETFFITEIRDKMYLGVHGDYDGFNKNGIINLSMILGFFPYAIIYGHKHHPAMNDINGVKIIQSGSLAGAGDDFTIEKRIKGDPSQTVLVCNKDGIVAHYPIYF